ncbi:hypothetical protein EYF80_016951 [Liparis tanakae]|uniref:Uncharacterized protein n=1 Tax=Liparis tanakae TaxID=230148 RepID=A0A4Z2I4T7_9TELE|nr:hypothetical protein EYF80_016951 [Liparis tanakae]
MQIASQETPGDVEEKLAGRQREANEYNEQTFDPEWIDWVHTATRADDTTFSHYSTGHHQQRDPAAITFSHYSTGQHQQRDLAAM